MKKIVFLMMAAGVLLVGMASCHKDDENNTNTNTTPQDTTQTTTQKHNVELVYGDDDETKWQHIELDTIQKYSNDKSVDTIFMIPEMSNQFSTNSTNGLKYIINLLRERKNINLNKVWGKGELQLKASSVDGYPEIRSFFSDTLGYNVTLTYQK